MFSSEVQNRLRKIIDVRFPKRGAYTQLSKETGISAAMWNHVYHGRAKVAAEHLEKICLLFPEYTLWLMTGLVRSETTQTSPDLEQLDELQKAVRK